MTKKELLKWIDQQEEAVLSELNEKRSEALNLCREKIIKEIGLDIIASEIQKKFTEIEEMLTTWEDSLEKGIVRPHEYWGTIYRDIHAYSNGPTATKNIILSNDIQIGESKAYKAIRKKYDDLGQKVRHEYATVYVNVQGLKNAKLGIEYLESLGFDLTELKEADAKPVTTALSVPINTDYLFIGGTK